MLTSRILPPAEWARLEGTESAPFGRAEPDASVYPLVVEDGERIVGTLTLGAYAVLEGLWIHPDFRHRISVARRLVREMRTFGQAQGVTLALAFAVSDEMEQMFTTFGGTRFPLVNGRAPVPFVMPLGETPCRTR